MTTLLQSVREYLRLRKVRRRFPHCVLHAGAVVSDDSALARAVVLFPGASILASTVGAYSYVQAGSLLSATDVGPFCSIASGVTIGMAGHPTSMVSTSPVFYDPAQPLPVFFTREPTTLASQPRTVVGADVWIGQGALVKAGITIGIGAVIGAGAIVTRDVPAYSVAAGNPCRVIRPRFAAPVAAALLDSRWWELDEAALRQVADEFADPLLLPAAIARLRRGGVS